MKKKIVALAMAATMALVPFTTVVSAQEIDLEWLEQRIRYLEELEARQATQANQTSPVVVRPANVDTNSNWRWGGGYCWDENGNWIGPWDDNGNWRGGPCGGAGGGRMWRQ